MDGTIPIRHEPGANRFFAELPDGIGELKYSRVAELVLDLQHAEVTPALRGRGVAGALVAAACEHARTAGLKLIPSCPYVEWWFRQHPDWRYLLLDP